MKLPKASIIYLDGHDTGLKAWSRNHAIGSMLTVLHRRGRFDVTADDLAATYLKSAGCVDFKTPPAKGLRQEGRA